MRNVRMIQFGRWFAVVSLACIAVSCSSADDLQAEQPVDDEQSIVAGATDTTIEPAASVSPSSSIGPPSTSLTSTTAADEGSATSASVQDRDDSTTSTTGSTPSTAATSATVRTGSSDSSRTSRSSTATSVRVTTSVRATSVPTTPSPSASSAVASTSRPAPNPSPDGTIHVSTNGSSSGDGSEARPFASLDTAFRSLQPGDTLIVHGGEYRERVRLWSGLARGTASDPITVRAADGERPVIKGILRIRGLHHWIIDGLNVTWDGERNTSNEHMVSFVDGSNWTYRNSEVWGARSYAGVLVGGDPVNWTLRGLHIHDTYRSNNTNQDHLIYCNCGSGGGLIERNLLVGSENGRAIKVGTVNADDTNVSNVTIRYNTMVDNRGPSNIQLSYRTSNILIERNVMVGSEAGYENITTYQLTGSGNVARNNVGWESASVIDVGAGLWDGGGNSHTDPGLDGSYRPSASFTGYGHRAS